ncbi:MAG TPA: asparaginase [Actinomycetota bacterium]|nr:asparaginase [Actinomycetota bacterium]
MPTAAPLVRVVRSGLVESVHLGHVVVCDPDGRVLAALGDPDRVLFSRSSMKPLQAAVSLRRIGDPMPDDLIALMCASHNGETVHVRVVRRLLRAGGLSERDLGCPPDLPMEPEARRTATRPRRITHNCSGKHAGMLLACERSGVDPARYLAPSHPLQRQIVRAIRTATDLDPAIGVDGCGAPVHGLPLRGMATLFARLSRPERLGPLEEHAARALAAMRSAPYLVAGRGRSDTRMMQEVPDLVTKVGAEGLHCAAPLGAGIGVAVRIEDGSDRAAAPALIRTLDLLGLLDDGQRAGLASVAAPAVLGGGRPVGALETRFRLRRPPR